MDREVKYLFNKMVTAQLKAEAEKKKLKDEEDKKKAKAQKTEAKDKGGNETETPGAAGGEETDDITKAAEGEGRVEEKEEKPRTNGETPGEPIEAREPEETIISGEEVTTAENIENEGGKAASKKNKTEKSKKRPPHDTSEL